MTDLTWTGVVVDGGATSEVEDHVREQHVVVRHRNPIGEVTNNHGPTQVLIRLIEVDLYCLFPWRITIQLNNIKFEHRSQVLAFALLLILEGK